MFTWKMNYGVWDKVPIYFWWVMIPLLVWEVVWKGIALWKSSRNAQKGWFVALLIVNSMGILPIIYLAFFQKRKK